MYDNNTLRNEALIAYNAIMNAPEKVDVPTDKRECTFRHVVFCAIVLSDYNNDKVRDLIDNMNNKMLVPFTEEEQYQYGHNILASGVY